MIKNIKLYQKPNYYRKDKIDILIYYNFERERRYMRETISLDELFDSVAELLIYGVDSFVYAQSVKGSPHLRDFECVLRITNEGVTGKTEDLFKLLIKELKYIKEMLI